MRSLTTSKNEDHLETVRLLSTEARTYVSKALQVEPDGTDATLPLVDHYLSQVPREPPEIGALVGAAVGCYFGELLRARFGGLWRFDGGTPDSWRLELAGVDVSIWPVAMARQAMARGADTDADDHIAVPLAYQQAVADALSNLGHVEESEYYSLACRYDTLETVMDLVVALRGQDGPR